MRFLTRRGGSQKLADSLDDIRAEIERLIEANRAEPSRETERRLLRLRHEAGIRLLDAEAGAPGFVAADAERLPPANGLPELTADQVTAGALRAGILRDGCLLVRGLVSPEDALDFGRRIDRAFDERERSEQGATESEGWYEEFELDPRFGEVMGRHWIKEGGGVLAADSPLLSFEMVRLFESAGLRSLVEDYLGEPVLISVEKTTLRKAAPSVPGAWHQDGNFMGAVRSLNLWLSLSRCGDEAPGLDVVPRRLDHIVTTRTEEAVLEIQVSQEKAEEAAGDKPIVRPIFNPGDALFFDELFLHKTGSDPSMPNPRFAIENWFFGASAFPAEYAPLAI
jgi:Phytanoyl-CoA dioxygenase (PhyH)